MNVIGWAVESLSGPEPMKSFIYKGKRFFAKKKRSTKECRAMANRLMASWKSENKKEAKSWQEKQS